MKAARRAQGYFGEARAKRARAREHRQTLLITQGCICRYETQKRSLSQSGCQVEPRIELLAEMRVTLEATKTRFLAEGVLQS